MGTFNENYNSEVDRYKRTGAGKSIDDFVDYGKLKWSSTLKLHLARGTYADFEKNKLRTCLYRPFTKMWLYYDEILNDRPGLFRYVLPTAASERENQIVCATNHLQMGFVVQITNNIANEAVGGRAGQCFPFYVYASDGSERRENITDWALGRFRKHYGDGSITKWDIFYYVYGLLHHPGYRARFADNLKRELPRIPFAPAGPAPSPPTPLPQSGARGAGRKKKRLIEESPLAPSAGRGAGGEGFWAFASAGKQLAELHLNYEQLEPFPLQFIESPEFPLSYRVASKMRLSRDKSGLAINESLALAGIPPETYDYRLGNRSALEWVIDQYQVSTDKRSGIKSDPNRPDDEQYIVRLVGQVVRVSVETSRIVAGLPQLFA